MKIRSRYIISICYYSKEELLNFISENSIEIFMFNVVDDYHFEFEISKKNYHKLSKHFSDIKIEKIYGFESIVNSILKNKITAISIVISLLFYMFLNTRIYSINIQGTNDYINNYIASRFDEFLLKKYQKMPNIDEIKKIEEILKMDLCDKVDLISITSKGTYIFVNYVKKGDEIILEQKHGKMYAKKDGIIKSINIESGKVMIDVNDYVKNGDLLVDDTLYYKDKPIVVGTLGRVMAYTYGRINVSCISTNMEKAEIYQLLLSKARYEISKSFDIYSYIEKEIVLSYVNQNNIATMDIHYTLVENIIKF